MKNKLQIFAIFWMVLATNTPNATAVESNYNHTPVCGMSSRSILNVDRPLTISADSSTPNPNRYLLSRRGDGACYMTIPRSSPSRQSPPSISLGAGEYRLSSNQCSNQIASLTFISSRGVEINITCDESTRAATVRDIIFLMGAENIHFSMGPSIERTGVRPLGVNPLKPSGRRTGQQGPKLLEDSSKSDSPHPVRLPPDPPWVDTTPTHPVAPAAQ